MLRFCIVILLLTLVLVGCDNTNSPDKTIRQYLEARITSDADKLRNLSCAALESQAILEANSFRGRNAELQGVSCKEAGNDGDYVIVACEGKIVATYQGEKNEVPLGKYRTIQEDGEWKMCGEVD
jgi:hypothetical protein